ncbi:MAG: purine-nucleoside phosphorylase [Oligoflexia bacterium]|nr:purine-nucleoside phosphorylase [Oligoflexia bacterium]
MTNMIVGGAGRDPEGDAVSTEAARVGNAAGRVYVAQLEEAAAAIRDRIGIVPNTLMILGSGLGSFVEVVEPRVVVPYTEIPHMPQTSTVGHAGNLIVGKVALGDADREIAIFQGRVHCHDALRPRDVAFGARVMALLGIENLIVTNAAGSLNADIQVGHLMAIRNHVSLFLPEDPSLGLEHPRLGPKFYPQTDAYSAELRRMFLEIAAEQGFADVCHEGNYCFLPGPRYESRADIDLLRALRVVDAVGMSTVPEVLAVGQMSGGRIRVLGISTMTNLAAGIAATEPSHEEVTREGMAAAPKLRSIIQELVARL